jgi:hypothetical protein
MTVYYVDGVDGNDGNAGTSEGSGNAWATIDKAMNTVAAGDKVWVKGNGTYVETPNIDTAGASTTPIVFEGYTTTTGDNGKATINSGSTNNLTDTTTASYYLFKNFIFTGATSHGVSLAERFVFINCDFTSNGGHGAQIGGHSNFLNCTFMSNTNEGIAAASGFYLTIVGCVFGNNGSKGISNTGANNYIYKSVFYGGGVLDHAITSGMDNSVLIGCTLDGENSALAYGIDGNNESWRLIVDNIFHDWDIGYYCTDTSGIGSFGASIGYNLFNSITTGNYRDASADLTATWEHYGYGDVSGAPAFTDEANDDYTLGASSPAIDAGVQPGGIT